MRFVAASLVVLAAAAGCGGNVVVQAGDAGGTGSTTCIGDADCPAGETCDFTTGMCAGPGGGCKSDVDCAMGFCSSTGECVVGGCSRDADCLQGEICNTVTGMCTVPPGPDHQCHQCACVDLLSEGGCANICDMAQSGTSTPNFCNGVAALPQCAKCLAANCSGITDPPHPSDPAACM
jgi:hypothetical protein